MNTEQARALIEGKLRDDTPSNVLDLTGNEAIGEEGALVLSDVLLRPDTKRLLSVMLRNAQIGNRGLVAIAEALSSPESTLSGIFLQSNGISDGAMSDFANMLAVNTTLTAIDLGHNQISDLGAIRICRSIVNNEDSKVARLILPGNQIGDMAAEDISALLHLSSTLTQLDLERNKILDHGASVISQGLCESTSLLEFNIRDNNLTQTGEREICRALLKNFTLKELTGIKLQKEHCLHALGLDVNQYQHEPNSTILAQLAKREGAAAAAEPDQSAQDGWEDFLGGCIVA